MKESSLSNSLKNLIKDPSELEALMENPGKYGIDLYKSLSAKNQQYIVFAAAAGLIVYGIMLNKKK